MLGLPSSSLRRQRPPKAPGSSPRGVGGCRLLEVLGALAVKRKEKGGCVIMGQEGAGCGVYRELGSLSASGRAACQQEPETPCLPWFLAEAHAGATAVPGVSGPGVPAKKVCVGTCSPDALQGLGLLLHWALRTFGPENDIPCRAYFAIGPTEVPGLMVDSRHFPGISQAVNHPLPSGHACRASPTAQQPQHAWPGTDQGPGAAPRVTGMGQCSRAALPKY